MPSAGFAPCFPGDRRRSLSSFLDRHVSVAAFEMGSGDGVRSSSSAFIVSMHTTARVSVRWQMRRCTFDVIANERQPTYATPSRSPEKERIRASGCKHKHMQVHATTYAYTSTHTQELAQACRVPHAHSRCGLAAPPARSHSRLRVPTTGWPCRSMPTRMTCVARYVMSLMPRPIPSSSSRAPRTVAWDISVLIVSRRRASVALEALKTLRRARTADGK